MSPREKEPEATGFARRVAEVLSSVIEQRGISKRELARMIGRSNNYVAMRFRFEAPFTLTDVDEICVALGLDAGSVLAAVAAPSNLVALNVPTSLDDLEVREPRTYALAADKQAPSELDAPAPGEHPED